MIAQSNAQSAAQSPHKAAHGSAHNVCPPLQGTHFVQTSLGHCADQPEQPARPAVIETVVSRLSLSDVTRCDPDVTAWIASVRARFPGARPLWGRSPLGEIGRQP